jgi:hypothetical protein
MKSTVQLVVVALVFSFAATEVRAQGPGRPLGWTAPPGYSPYLNLLRPGTNPAINYYGLVRPQQQFARSMQFIQGELTNQSTTGDMQSDAGAPTTGHSIYFLNYGGYFMNTRGGQVSSGFSGPGRMPVAAQPGAPARAPYRR